jgi:hypothetical protein
LQGAAVDALEDSLASRDLIVDNGTLQWLAGKINIKDASIGAVKLATNAVTTAKVLDANVTWAKLAQAVKDSITTGGSGNGFDNELLNQTVSSDLDSSVIDISSFSYTNPPDVVIANKSGWAAYIKNVTAAAVTVGIPVAGFGDNAVFDLFFVSND